MKSGPEHAMRAEIFEQPDVLERLAEREGARARRLGKLLAGADARFLLFAARGSSDHAAVLGKYLSGLFLGLPAGLAAPSLRTLYGARLRLKGSIVVGISQSGHSEDVVEYVSAAGRLGAVTVGITNDGGSPLAKAARHVLLCHAGAERSIPATKTFTAQLGCLYLLLGAWSGNPKPEGAMRKAPKLIRDALAAERLWASRLERLRGMDRCVVLGRGFSFPVALETALKLKEAAGVFAEGASSADFMHGPVAMASSRMDVWALAPRGKAFPSLMRSAVRAARAGARLSAFTDEEGLARKAALAVRLPPGCDELSAPFPLAAMGQLAAYRLAVLKGRDPDKPAGLKKVTLTR